MTAYTVDDYNVLHHSKFCGLTMAVVIFFSAVVSMGRMSGHGGSSVCLWLSLDPLCCSIKHKAHDKGELVTMHSVKIGKLLPNGLRCVVVS